VISLFAAVTMPASLLTQLLLALLVPSCGSKSTDVLCETDLSMGDLKTRYYDIKVTATDSAGNIGSDTCRVVVIPSCKPQDHGCEKFSKTVPYVKGTESYYYAISAVNNSVAQSEVLYEAAKQTCVWKNGLQLPQAPPDSPLQTAPPTVAPSPSPSSKSAKIAKEEVTKPWESDAETKDATQPPTSSPQPSLTTLPSSQPSSSSQPKAEDITSPPTTSPTTSPTSAPTKVSLLLNYTFLDIVFILYNLVSSTFLLFLIIA